MAALASLHGYEAKFLAVAQQYLAKRPQLRREMSVLAVELQLDKKKLIVYSVMSRWIMFNDLVKTLRRACEKLMGVMTRIFIQRKCTFLKAFL